MLVAGSMDACAAHPVTLRISLRLLTIACVRSYAHMLRQRGSLAVVPSFQPALRKMAKHATKGNLAGMRLHACLYHSAGGDTGADP